MLLDQLLKHRSCFRRLSGLLERIGAHEQRIIGNGTVIGDNARVEQRRCAVEIASVEFDAGAEDAGEGGGFSSRILGFNAGNDVFGRQHVVARHRAHRIEGFLFSGSLRPRDAARAHEVRQRSQSDNDNAN